MKSKKIFKDKKNGPTYIRETKSVIKISLSHRVKIKGNQTNFCMIVYV
jgi:hypothetical protein